MGRIQYLLDEWSDDVINSDTFFGIVCATAVAPKHLYHPVLPCKMAGKLYYSLRDEDLIEQVWTSVEIKKAYEVGYSFTVHVYHEYKFKEGVWNPFLRKMYLQKLMNSGKAPERAEDRDRLAADHEKFGMGDLIKNSFSNWGSNPAKRAAAKIAINSIWGKHCQKHRLEDHKFFGEYDEAADEMFMLIENSASGLKEMISFSPYGEMHLLKTRDSGNSNIDLHHDYLPAGVFVPAYARLKLLKILEPLGKRVLYHDTDSIIYVHDKTPGAFNPSFGTALGDFAEEGPSKEGIIKFCASAPKSYALKVKNGKDVVKIKGISLKHGHQEKMAFETIFNTIKHGGKTSNPQMTFKNTPGSHIETIYFEKMFQFNKSDLKGDLHDDGYIYPHGYCHTDEGMSN